MKTGLIHVYCGDGKGKTTAALGLTLRAAGRGLKVLVVQFLKNQPTGELKMLDRLDGVTVLRGKAGNVFSFRMSEAEKALSAEIHNDNLKRAIALARAGAVDVLILDEVLGAYDKNLLDRALLLEFLRAKPQGVEVVLTGRNPHEEVLALADYVSEIKKIKHPYDRGIMAREGIEF